MIIRTLMVGVSLWAGVAMAGMESLPEGAVDFLQRYQCDEDSSHGALGQHWGRLPSTMDIRLFSGEGDSFLIEVGEKVVANVRHNEEESAYWWMETYWGTPIQSVRLEVNHGQATLTLLENNRTQGRVYVCEEVAIRG